MCLEADVKKEIKEKLFDVHPALFKVMADAYEAAMYEILLKEDEDEEEFVKK